MTISPITMETNGRYTTSLRISALPIKKTSANSPESNISTSPSKKSWFTTTSSLSSITSKMSTLKRHHETHTTSVNVSSVITSPQSTDRTMFNLPNLTFRRSGTTTTLTPVPILPMEDFTTQGHSNQQNSTNKSQAIGLLKTMTAVTSYLKTQHEENPCEDLEDHLLSIIQVPQVRSYEQLPLMAVNANDLYEAY